MDEKLQKKLIRQLRAIRFWLSFFGIVTLTGFCLLGFFIFKLVATVNSAEAKLTNIQSKTAETLDVKSKLCQSSFTANSNLCK